MTLRPPKHSEKKKLEEKIRRKQRKFEEENKLPPYTLIISEGEKTEPHYIQGLVKLINTKYYRLIRNDRIYVFGTGRNTKNLLKFAREYANDHKIYTRIWLMYDKDDFPYDNFDNTAFSIEDENDSDRRYFAAWSNECIELWFILYFQDLVSNVDREQYRTILKKYFDYEKNLTNLYEILDEKGDINSAISRAKKLYEENNHKNSPSQMAPVTRVYELVEELRGYLDS